MKKWLMMIAAFFAVAVAVPLWAQKSDADLEAMIMQKAQAGPKTIDLGSEATLQLPTGLLFIDKETATKLWKRAVAARNRGVTALLSVWKAGWRIWAMLIAVILRMTMPRI